MLVGCCSSALLVRRCCFWSSVVGQEVQIEKIIFLNNLLFDGYGDMGGIDGNRKSET
jgi:hypothetical protein